LIVFEISVAPGRKERENREHLRKHQFGFFTDAMCKKAERDFYVSSPQLGRNKFLKSLKIKNFFVGGKRRGKIMTGEMFGCLSGSKGDKKPRDVTVNWKIPRETISISYRGERLAISAISRASVHRACESVDRELEIQFDRK
jgi:hypothetical protein